MPLPVSIQRLFGFVIVIYYNPFIPREVSIQRLFGFVCALSLAFANALFVSIQRLFGFVVKVPEFTQRIDRVSIQRLFGFVYRIWKYQKRGKKVSIQRLFGFVAPAKVLLDTPLVFQYNDCLGSSVLWQVWYYNQQSFNTTIVWVRQVTRNTTEHLYLFQYNDCLGSSSQEVKVKTTDIEFQYNDCLGSSLSANKSNRLNALFQYNDCLGSSRIESSISSFGSSFQYNDCLGSSVSLLRILLLCLPSFNTTIVWVRHKRQKRWGHKMVSIQRLFGFVHSFGLRKNPQSYVSIQRLFGFVFCNKSSRYTISRFQYNDCLGSSSIILIYTLKDIRVSIQRLFGFVNNS